MDKNIYTQADFMNLTYDEAADIVRILEIDLPNNTDIKNYLYSNMSIIETNEDANRIVSKKVLAGQVTVKWFRFEYSDGFTKEELLGRLHKPELGYNISIMERTDSYDTVTCIVKHGDIYTLKILINDGYTTSSNGVNVVRDARIRSIVVKIDTTNCWLEMRCPENKVGKVISILSREINMPAMSSVLLLSKFSNDINKFKSSLYNGVYINYSAIPSEPLDLTEKDKTAVAIIINSLDEYLQDKNSQKLIEILDSMQYDTEELSIVSILLAGLDTVGMGIKRGCGKDMSDQSFYSILKDHIIENTSFISFSTTQDGISYTMQVGQKSNHIRFRTSVTEDVIEYLRSIIL